ncbi:6-aminohexanoate-dimer hydrolase [Ensifer adhaerens]|nr:6-aminohexanoate-dimer hydrolase [Ensifer adhaerens]
MEELAPTHDHDDGWLVSRPEDEAMDGSLLSGLAPQFESWTDANVHAVLIVRHSKLVYEHYFAGQDKAWATPLGHIQYRPELRHDLRSITKSITSLLFGIAVDRGWIRDLNEPVFSFFPEHADLQTSEKDQINLQHLLTMSAGLAWNEYLPYSNPANSERRMIDAPDQCRYVLEQLVVRPPGVAYVYNGGLTALLAAMLQKTTGRPIDLLAEGMLFRPLGIHDVEWVRYADGTPNAVSGLRMRPRDVAKIGQLVLDRGKWNGVQIVSEPWVDESTNPHVNGEGLFFYGFQWWLGRSLVRRQEIKCISGVGMAAKGCSSCRN